MIERDRPILTAIAEGVHAWVQPCGSWWVNNAGAITADGETLLIDTCVTERRTRDLLRAVSQVADGIPPAFAVNTRAGGGHSYGNKLLPASTVVVDCEQVDAHSSHSDGLTAGTMQIGHIRIELRVPDRWFMAAGFVLPWLPEQRTLFTGDLLLNRVTPLVFAGGRGDSSRILDWISRLRPDVVVPGHGPIIGAADLPEAIEVQRRYCQLVAETARAGLSDGLSPAAAARRCQLGAFALLPDADRLVLNLHRAYAGLTGARIDCARARIGTQP